MKKQSISIKKVAILTGATIHQYYGTAQYIGTYAVALVALITVLLGVEKLIEIN